ncbi:MAG: hypothetical protein Q4G18_04685 [Myroides sp.]|nr:hypothetical protein [Myroides sp.]
MKNPFKEIITEKELPEVIKDKVINDVNLIKLSLELSELFFVSMPDVAVKFFKTDKNNNTN